MIAMLRPAIGDIYAAAGRINDAILNTPFVPSQTLSRLTDSELWLKFENLQFVASFKERGALNALLCLSPEQRASGVIAMSAGNHAQGLAYHASRLGIRSTIVMPVGTPKTKVSRTIEHGATVLLRGANFAEAGRATEHLARIST
jgi:threonine dehydratase